MDSAKQQLIDALKAANNVLVTVSRNPSVDQLASCIGLTLLLNKQGKHAAAVFSGQVPSTLEFLQPEDTLEKNTDSLRDFIIALDKSKADKLRYKVEDNVVRIFITPYKTSISQDDLEFSEGDFNVDIVIALGVHQQEDLDEAIVAHGRILHDATVTSINTTPDGGLGTINWYDPQASSLSELVTDLTQSLGAELLDNQIATALLTGIVSETERFSNDKTSSQTMSASAALMAAGANQQLVASKLGENGKALPSAPAGNITDQPNDSSSDDGTLQIDHNNEPPEGTPPEAPTVEKPSEPMPPFDNGASNGPNTDTGNTSAFPPATLPPESPAPPQTQSLSPGARLVTEPPTMGGTLTANSRQEGLEPTTDPFSLPQAEPPQLLDRKASAFGGAASSDVTLPSTAIPAASASLPAAETPVLTPPPASWMPPAASTSTPPKTSTLTPTSDMGDQTLTEIEKAVGDPHAQVENVDSARDEVSRALLSNTDTAATDGPIQALSAQPLGGSLHANDNTGSSPASNDAQAADSAGPPPVPPPIPFQFNNPPPPQSS